MRAFMSEQWPDGGMATIGAADWHGGNLIPVLQERAVREARRILAVTEPRDAHRAGSGREYRSLAELASWRQWPHPNYRETSACALAEALAAFVEG